MFSLISPKANKSVSRVVCNITRPEIDTCDNVCILCDILSHLACRDMYNYIIVATLAEHGSSFAAIAELLAPTVLRACICEKKGKIKMKKITKLSVLLLTLTLLAAFFGACTDNTPSGDDSTTSAADTTAAVDTEDTSAMLSIPEHVTLGGDTMGVLYWSDVENPEFFVEETNEKIDKTLEAIKTRNAQLESRMDVKLDFIPQAGNQGKLESFVSYIASSYKSGDHSFDIIAGYSQTVANAAYNNYCADLNTLDYIDFEKPWWPSLLTKEATVNGKLYFVSGDISTNLLYMMYTVFFNKDMLETHPDLRSPYELVASNEWTIDNMLTMCQGFYSDRDSSGTQSADDTFGLILPRLGLDTFFYGAGLRTTDKNADGTLVVSDSYFSEKAEDLLQKLGKVCFDSNDGYWTGKPEIFAAGNALFYCDRAVRSIKNLSDVSFDFGVAPAPKWNSDQEAYYTCAGNPFTLYSVMGNSTRPDMAAAVLECWGYQAYNTTTPAIFEITMKIRFAKDSESAKMYDMIRDGVTFDLGRIYGLTMKNLTQSLYRNAMADRSSWTARRAMYTSQMETYLVGINEAYR